jgi:hypothetical protein
VLAAAPDRDRLRSAAAAIARVRAWCDSVEVAVTRSLGSVAAAPELELAAAMRTSTGAAGRVADRAAVVAELPAVEAALEDGRVHGAHVDEVTKVLRSLAPVDHAVLLERVDRLVDVAAVATPAEFGRRVRQEAARIRSDGGMSLLERQRGACRATSRVNIQTGMWELRASFDPFTGACLSRRLEAATEALLHGEPIEHTPHDPFERAEFLRAHALKGLIDGTASGGSGSGRPEIVIVVSTSVDAHATRALDATHARATTNTASAAGNVSGGRSTVDAGVHEAVATVARLDATHGRVATSSVEPITSTCATTRLRTDLPASFDQPTTDTPDLDPAPPGRADSNDAPPRGAPPGSPRGTASTDTAPAATPREPDPPPAFSIDWGLPVEIPARVLTDLALDPMVNADVHVVVLGGGIILHAPGTLDLGRTTRLANRAQRRALRARYPRCLIPGCEVPFHKCDIHHVVWWRHGGRTDLDNLGPLCAHHHTCVHDHGWQLTRNPDGTITVTLRDGTVLGPEVR